MEFEGLAGAADTGHVALDDIVYEAGEECPMEGVCDFQVGSLCNWINDEEDDADWIVAIPCWNCTASPRFVNYFLNSPTADILLNAMS